MYMTWKLCRLLQPGCAVMRVHTSCASPAAVAASRSAHGRWANVPPIGTGSHARGTRTTLTVASTVGRCGVPLYSAMRS